MTIKRFFQASAIGILAVAAVLIAAYGLFQVSKLRTFQFFGGLTARVETNEKVVALTFDDAPSPHSDTVLDILATQGVPATFYVIGEAIEKYPDAAKRIVDEGHELGNHSYTHDRFLLKSQKFIDHEIQTTNTLIRASGYEGEITFRPPYGKKLFGLPWYLKQHNIKSILWDVEPDTYVSGTDNIVNYTLDTTEPGSIILLHPFCDACQNDRDAIAPIIDGLQAEGYRFVTVSELLTLE